MANYQEAMDNVTASIINGTSVNVTSSIDEGYVESNDSAIIRGTLRVWGSIYAGAFIVYCFLRLRYPRLFNVRSWAPGLESDIAKKEYGYISWLWEVFKVSDRDLIDQCSMDVLCFVRAMRFGRQLSLLGCFNALWLLPLYGTAELDLNDPFAKISTSNLAEASPRFVGTIVATYITFLVTMCLIFRELRWYTGFRHRFLSKRIPRNYAVYVSGIPRSFRSSCALLQYFRECFPDAVKEAHIALDIPNLESRVARRQAVVDRLEHIVAHEKQKGYTKKQIKLGRRGIETVETVPMVEKDLAAMNSEISQTIRGILSAHDEFRSTLKRTYSQKNVMCGFTSDDEDETTVCSSSRGLSSPMTNTRSSLSGSPCENLERVPEDCALAVGEDVDIEIQSTESASSSTCAVAEKTDLPENSECAALTHEVVDIKIDPEQQQMTASSSQYSFFSSVSSGTKAVAAGTVGAGLVAGQTLAAGSVAAGKTILKAAKDVNGAVIQTATEHAKTAQLMGSNVVSSASAVVPVQFFAAEGNPRRAGFVVFRTLYATQTALQMVHHPKPYVMDVQEAPDPGDIFWRNVGLLPSARRTGWAMSVAATVVLCFFWSMPMAFIASLTEVNSLKEMMPRLGEFIDNHPNAEQFLALVAPLVLLLLSDVILPEILKHFAKWEGHVSSVMLDASLFVKLGVFMIIQTFFVSALSGGIFAELTNMMRNPALVIELLAVSLPGQSSYFIQIILTSTFLIQALEFLRVYPLGLALLRRFFGPRLTKKERERRWGWLHPLEDPPDFWHAETFAQLILFYMVFFVYAVIAPVTAFFLFFCFSLIESGYRYQFVHNYPKAFDTGGKIWFQFIRFTLASMMIAQLTILGLMMLKKCFYAVPALAPLMAITLLFIIFINSQHARVTQNLPTRDCMSMDKYYEDYEDSDFAARKYLQPALQHLHVEPKYED